MTSYDTMFSLCCEQVEKSFKLPPSFNMTKVHLLCHLLTKSVHDNHTYSGVLDFENLAPINEAWWINGLLPTILTFITLILNSISVLVFVDPGHRTPTNALLATISAIDLLTCISQLPATFYIYLLDGYKKLPSRFWCDEYNYFHTFVPTFLHSAAILLNMGVSIQRCIGVRNIRKLKCMCSYKGTLVVVILSTVLSVCVHAINVANYHVEDVAVFSKQVRRIWALGLGLLARLSNY